MSAKVAVANVCPVIEGTLSFPIAQSGSRSLPLQVAFCQLIAFQLQMV